MVDLTQIGFIFILAVGAGYAATRLKLSVIPAYLLCGILIGPAGFNIVSDTELIEFSANIGILLLLFSVGLEFSISRLLKSGKPIIYSGIVDLLINLPLGYFCGLIFGLTQVESLFLAGIVYMSSSGIIIKSLTDLRRLANPESELILGLMIFEDIFITVFLAVLSGIAIGGEMSLISISSSMIKSILFCFVFFFISAKYGRSIDKVLNIKSDELFTILVFALILLISGLAGIIGISEEVGAFLAGLVFSDTAHIKKIEEKMLPLKDIFVAVFFLFFGMTISFTGFLDVWSLLLTLIPLSILSKIISGYISGKINGYSTRASFNIGFGIIARGEFSIVLSDIVSKNTASPLISMFTSVYVFILSLLSPFFMQLPNKVFKRVRSGKDTKAQKTIYK